MHYEKLYQKNNMSYSITLKISSYIFENLIIKMYQTILTLKETIKCIFNTSKSPIFFLILIILWKKQHKTLTINLKKQNYRISKYKKYYEYYDKSIDKV